MAAIVFCIWFKSICTGPQRIHLSLNQMMKKTVFQTKQIPTCSSTRVTGLIPMTSQPICTAAVATVPGCFPTYQQGQMAGRHPVPGCHEHLSCNSSAAASGGSHMPANVEMPTNVIISPLQGVMESASRSFLFFPLPSPQK